MRRRKIGARARFEVLRRCEFACFYCGDQPPTSLTIDHVVPVAKGGTDDEWNLVAACQPCNAGKLDSVPGQETIARALSLWRYHIAMAGRDSWFCYVCGRPVQIEPDALEDRDIAQCPSCNAAICAAYEDGIKVGRRSSNAVV